MLFWLRNKNVIFFGYALKHAQKISLLWRHVQGPIIELFLNHGPVFTGESAKKGKRLRCSHTRSMDVDEGFCTAFGGFAPLKTKINLSELDPL